MLAVKTGGAGRERKVQRPTTQETENKGKYRGHYQSAHHVTSYAVMRSRDDKKKKADL